MFLQRHGADVRLNTFDGPLCATLQAVFCAKNQLLGEAVNISLSLSLSFIICARAVFSPPLPRHLARGGPSSRLDDLMLAWPHVIPGQMQWILFLLLLFINSMEMLTQARRRKRVSVALFENCTGCVMCSEDNGCTACQQRLFLLIWRDGIRQYGACVHACPPGYFGLRGKELNRCSKCRSPSCESCFSKDFCMKCKEHFFLHKGKCFSACPPETLAQSSTRECQEKCETGPWANWSPCTNQGRTCGFKWGTTTRAREAVRSSKEESAMCPTLTESRKCRMKKHCPGEKNEKKRKGKREKKERKKKRKMDSLMAT